MPLSRMTRSCAVSPVVESPSSSRCLLAKHDRAAAESKSFVLQITLAATSPLTSAKSSSRLS